MPRTLTFDPLQCHMTCGSDVWRRGLYCKGNKWYFLQSVA